MPGDCQEVVRLCTGGDKDGHMGRGAGGKRKKLAAAKTLWRRVNDEVYCCSSQHSSGYAKITMYSRTTLYPENS